MMDECEIEGILLSRLHDTVAELMEGHGWELSELLREIEDVNNG